MDIIGLYRADTNIASIKQVGPLGVAITLKTPDSQFIAANLNLQFVVPQHIWSKVKDAGDVQEPDPGRLGPVHDDHAPDDAGHRVRQEPELLAAGQAEGRRASSTRRRPRTTPRCSQIQSGKVDWTHNFVPNVESVYEAKDPAHYHAFYAHHGVPGLAHVRRHAVPVQPRAAAPGDEHGDQPR